MHKFYYKCIHIASGRIYEKEIECLSEEDFHNKINSYNRMAALEIKSPVWIYFWEQ